MVLRCSLCLKLQQTLRLTYLRAQQPSAIVARLNREASRIGVARQSATALTRAGSARVAPPYPDGYTLLAGRMGSHVSAPVLTANLKYDSERDFVPIGFTAQSPAVIVARKDFAATDLREFVDYLKKNGDRVKQAHGGI